MIEPQNYTYEQFPENVEDLPQEVKVLETCRDDRFIVYKPNIKYIERSGLELQLQILKPEYADQRKEKFPCIMYIQGSAWMQQDTYFILPNLAKLANKGFVVACVQYRHSAVAPFPAQLIDSKTAIRFMRKNADEYGVDADNIFVFGDSSGGHTALLAGITQENRELDSSDYKEYSNHVNAVVDYYGPVDISKMNEVPSTLNHILSESPEGMLIGGKNVLENLELSKRTCPISYLSQEQEIPPVLIFHGSKDRLVPFNQSVLIYSALKEFKKEVEFYKLKGADHGGPQFWTEEVLDIIEEFLRKYIREK